jgi:hypothetical protein
MAALTPAELAQLQERLAEAKAAERAEALSSLNSFKQWLAHKGFDWMWEKIGEIAGNVRDWFQEVIPALLS